MGHCTMPRAFGVRKWLEERFEPYYREHDEGYDKAEESRFMLDCKLAGRILLDGYPLISFSTFLITRVAGFNRYGKSK